VLRLTAQNSAEGKFPRNVSDYVNGIFRGTTRSPIHAGRPAPVAAGLTCSFLPARRGRATRPRRAGAEIDDQADDWPPAPSRPLADLVGSWSATR
jgi:hypothetical protein